MKILFGIRQFGRLTGAELYAYELGRELVRQGHDFTIAAPAITPGILAHKAAAAGLGLAAFTQIGDRARYDIMHLNEPRPTNYFLDRFKTTPAVATIHSQWPCEEPIRSPRISRYICIREEIRQKITRQDGIPIERTAVIPNGVDLERFRPKMGPPGRRTRVLFVGTLDFLRRPTIADLAARARMGEIEFWLCGENLHPPQDPKAIFQPSQYFKPRWDIETLFQAVDETAGILMGRTTIEGWACGKPGWIYDVDLQGWIQSRALHQPPADMSQFDIRIVATRILEIYKEARNP